MQELPPAARIGVSKITLVVVQRAFVTVTFDAPIETTSEAARLVPEVEEV